MPDLTDELVILTVGARTGKRSKRSKKAQLYEQNAHIVRELLPQLVSSRVIVVTNQSTRITKFLVEHGIEAYGVGVGNDQLRFANQLSQRDDRLYLVGGHNFYDLVVGSWYNSKPMHRFFSHDDYKTILSQQDSLRKKLTWRPSDFLDYEWKELCERNASFPPEYRWYARQRIHSKHHSTTISCALSTLNIASLLIGIELERDIATVELPINLPGICDDCVIGWPINTSSRAPVELTFDNGALSKLKSIASDYRIPRGDHAQYDEGTFLLRTPFGVALALRWEAEKVYKFYSSHLKHLLSISRARATHAATVATIRVMKDRSFFNQAISTLAESDWFSTPQHRGRNLQEHTDIRTANLGDARAVRLPTGDAVALIDDKSLNIDFYCKNEKSAFHELRRIIRDEIVVPMLVSTGAHIFHAGICRFESVNILIVGPSGGGKTTLALMLLADCQKKSAYGSAERTAVWLENDKFMGLGVPESITVFPGTLKGLPQFSDMVKGARGEDDWVRDSKIRLQQSEIVQRTDSALLQGAVPIDLVLEVCFDKDDANVRSRGAVISPLGLEEALRGNDITHSDTVRLAWLNWFQKTPDDEFYNKQKELYALPEVARVTWRDASALKEVVIGIVARKRLGRSL